MKASQFNRATHFSIIWGITLAVMTLLEWNSLDREPMKQQILSPFIERSVTVSVARETTPGDDIADLPAEEPRSEAALRYTVDFNFNGPLFLACFFGPVAVFHGIGLLSNRRRKNRQPD